ncbi:MAG: hypothetical protein KZQ99_16240, partial [Candidatus Thiodiazotropha sp. (ex Dulcina madagascariensis)]|nr:hypothetical protein [Candidatus Thiodiazotropha sp. (ex Dulcina madagascariensis)]
RPQCACLQAALSKLAVGRLQRRFDALLQAGSLRLKVHYLVAGLIKKAALSYNGAAFHNSCK